MCFAAMFATIRVTIGPNKHLYARRDGPCSTYCLSTGKPFQQTNTLAWCRESRSFQVISYHADPEINMTTKWSFEANANTLIDNFAAVVETDTVTKGSWQMDFDAFCDKYKVVRCPLIKAAVIANDKESCRAMNGIIDLSSWRAMLLACCTTGSKVIEISVHGCRLEPQHLVDLSTALRKMGTCQSVKLQYLDWQDGEGLSANATQFQEGFAAVLNDAACLEYVSLKGNQFTDDFMAPILSSLSQNFKLSALNVSHNLLTDHSVRVFLKAVRCTTNIRIVSFEANHITGECLPALAELFNGCDASAEDDTLFKGNVKVVGEKNKQIKEANKKRKKGGLVELKEVNPSVECIIKRDGKLVLVNRSLKRADFSHNAELRAENVQVFAQALAGAAQNPTLPQAAVVQGEEGKVSVDFTACAVQDGAVNTAPQTWVQLVL